MRRVYLLWLMTLPAAAVFQGGYFYHEALWFGALQGLFCMWLIVDSGRHQGTAGEAGFSLRPLFWLYGGIVLSAAIGWGVALDRGMHIVGCLKLAAPLLLLANLYGFSGRIGKRIVKDLSAVLALTGVLSVMVMLVVFAVPDGSSPLRDYFIQSNRIGGIFQYANTYGVFLYGCMVMMMMGAFKKTPAAVGVFLLGMGIQMTQSRGSLYVYGMTWLILMVIGRGWERWLQIIGASGLAAGNGVLYLLSGQVDVYRSIGPKGNTSEWMSRLLYYDDGLDMLASRSFGYGHLGYYHIHRTFQTGAAYKVKFIHSSLLELGIDHGWIAMGLGLVLGLYVLCVSVRLFGSCGFHKPLLIGTVGGLGMFGHSLIDFDFQFTGFLVLWLVVLFCVELQAEGIGKNAADKTSVKGCSVPSISRGGRGRTGMMTGIVGIAVVFMVYFGVVALLDHNDRAELALKLYPHYSDSIDGVITGKETLEGYPENVKAELALEQVGKNPFYSNGFAFLRDYHYNNGDLETAISHGKTVVSLLPLRLDHYGYYAGLVYEHVLDLYEAGQLTKDNQYLLDLTMMDVYLEDLEDQRGRDYEVRHRVEFEMTPDMQKINDNARKLWRMLGE